MKPPILVVILALGSLLMTFGCGGPAKPAYPTVKVAGTVRVDGVAVEEGRIRFSPIKPEQAPAAETTISTGRYSVDNAPVGSVLVTFTGVKKTGRTTELYGMKMEETVNIIPVKYSRGLPATIDAAGNRDFDLTFK